MKEETTAGPLGRLIRRCTDEIADYLEKEDAFTALRALYGLEKEISDNSETLFFAPRPFLLGEMGLCRLLRETGEAGVLPPGFRQYLEAREGYLSPVSASL